MQVETMRFILKSLNDRFGRNLEGLQLADVRLMRSRIADVAGNVRIWDE
jgi:hypothetical protein